MVGFRWFHSACNCNIGPIQRQVSEELAVTGYLHLSKKYGRNIPCNWRFQRWVGFPYPNPVVSYSNWHLCWSVRKKPAYTVWGRFLSTAASLSVPATQDLTFSWIQLYSPYFFLIQLPRYWFPLTTLNSRLVKYYLDLPRLWIPVTKMNLVGSWNKPLESHLVARQSQNFCMKGNSHPLESLSAYQVWWTSGTASWISFMSVITASLWATQDLTFSWIQLYSPYFFLIQLPRYWFPLTTLNSRLVKYYLDLPRLWIPVTKMNLVGSWNKPLESHLVARQSQNFCMKGNSHPLESLSAYQVWWTSGTASWISFMSVITASLWNTMYCLYTVRINLTWSYILLTKHCSNFLSNSAYSHIYLYLYIYLFIYIYIYIETLYNITPNRVTCYDHTLFFQK